MSVASQEGLEGISIGQLAGDLGMSKSGLIAHFGSKEELQLATIENACTQYNEQIVKPAQLGGNKRGLARLSDLCDKWLSYHEKDPLPGGCFFIAVSSEFDSRTGPVRERIKKTMAQWSRLLTRELEYARRVGEISPDIDIQQIAFELNSIGHGANWAYQLYNDINVFARARTAINRRLIEAKSKQSLETSKNTGIRPASRKTSAK